MPKQFRIKVTQADIDAATAHRQTWVRWDTAHQNRNVTPPDAPPFYSSERHCPIAQALVRMGFWNVRAHPDYLSFQRKPYHWMLPDHYTATETIRRAMRDWDRRWRMTPRIFVTTER